MGTIILFCLVGIAAGFGVGYYVVNQVVLKKKKEEIIAKTVNPKWGVLFCTFCTTIEGDIKE